jgi:hypothetical protein
MDRLYDELTRDASPNLAPATSPRQ